MNYDYEINVLKERVNYLRQQLETVKLSNKELQWRLNNLEDRVAVLENNSNTKRSKPRLLSNIWRTNG